MEWLERLNEAKKFDMNNEGQYYFRQEMFSMPHNTYTKKVIRDAIEMYVNVFTCIEVDIVNDDYAVFTFYVDSFNYFTLNTKHLSRQQVFDKIDNVFISKAEIEEVGEFNLQIFSKLRAIYSRYNCVMDKIEFTIDYEEQSVFIGFTVSNDKGYGIELYPNADMNDITPKLDEMYINYKGKETQVNE